ncbi:chemotaxis protein [Salipiger aestuarii]|uniref:Chemotaxis protein methyltransferase n=1 Tax=Salipiger aestuarii TaxID=568098 RepID=A0A327Y8Y5_9RHOB|nr:protein-glutamate O-methyltransferase CheR [Salipiger aestuarii]EIE49636.1 MCP methyltransferase, CheR-type [Citreicella sp. 357]KAA8607152.1 chemotaxis protein [Salipiger aestuarii]KAA8611040.1 chemotaxis protein [Salipiger aestuarii]KAB2542274.1 chemotaxis protein [Salipiger aestuarii]RAK16961.1 chemotaxis protein methyltransferase CheR [Salipiger aestuarii]
MNTAPAGLNTREFSFTDADFRALAKLAHSEFGLALAESKKPLVYSRLARRLRAREVNEFSDYMKLLTKTDETDERLQLISALTTNVTSFFREKHHFATLREKLVPELAQQARVRIWSAGCSSGQEPFSIAMTLHDSLPERARRDVRLLATDIDPAVVSRARAAKYPKEEAETIPEDLRRRWTTTCPDDPDKVAISAAMRDMISFAELNLMQEWPFKGPFDAIFCRNVAIYFDQNTQKRLWARFTDMLRPGGYLFIGHSERVTGDALATLTTAGVTTYRKNGGADTGNAAH